VHFLSSAPAGSAWTFGASILTFAFPMILVIAVGTALWILYTKPELVPGRPAGNIERPVSATPLPRQPATAGQAAAAAAATTAAATMTDRAVAPEDRAATATGEGAAVTPTEDSEAAATEDGA
jgi:hypothetical protein